MSAAFDRDALLDAFDTIAVRRRRRERNCRSPCIAVRPGCWPAISGSLRKMSTCPNLTVSVPSAEYLPALKLKAFRIMDPLRGETERMDMLNLMRVVGVSTAEDAIDLLGRYFPLSAASSEKQQFLLKNMDRTGAADAPKYPR